MTTIGRVVLPEGEVWAVLEGGSGFQVRSLEDRRFLRPLGAVDDLTFTKPVAATSTVVCLLGNWKGREGRDGPSFFVKPNASLIADGDAIVHPGEDVTVVYEPEIAAVIGRSCRNVSTAEARDHVLGWTAVNDVTATELGVHTNFPFLPGKSYDSFGVVGPVIQTDLDPDDVALRARVNGRLLTDTRTSRMNWSTDEVVSWVSRFMTLRPGDLVCFGTPPEIGPIEPDDDVEVEVEGVGVLRNQVVRR